MAYYAISKAIYGIGDTKLQVAVPISRRGSDVSVVDRRSLLVTALGMNIVDTVLNQMSKESTRDIFPDAPEGLLSVKGNKLEIKDDNPQTKKQILQMMLDSKEIFRHC